MRSDLTWTVAIILGIAAAALLAFAASARDDGRYADSELKPWFDSLHNGNKVPCCDTADGQKVEDVDWDTGGKDGRYRVRLKGQWIEVPDDAVIKEPNRYGPAVVRPVEYADKIFIRCFLPGAGA